MSSFRTIEISDPSYEYGGLRFMTVKSNNLRGRGDICLFVPPGNVDNLPIYILLHGVYGSAWGWALKGGAHRTATQLMETGTIRPAILAMPSDGLWGDGSGYLSHARHDFAQWIVHDVPLAIVENIGQAGKNAARCIGGLSMGGYGALMLGARFPEKFKAVSAHSAITRFEQMADFVEEPLHDYQIGDAERNVIDAIRKNKELMPPLRFDCGLEDDLLQANRTLHNELNQLGLAHTYEEFEGGHEWPYWQEHVAKTFKFFDAQVIG